MTQMTVSRTVFPDLLRGAGQPVPTLPCSVDRPFKGTGRAAYKVSLDLGP